MTMVTGSYRFHENFASTMQNYIEDLNKIEQQDEPPFKRLKSDTPSKLFDQTFIIQKIQRDLFDNACKITNRDKEALTALLNKIAQLSPEPGSDEENLCKQIASLFESLERNTNLKNLPLEIIKKIAFDLPYTDLRNFLNSYKFIRQEDFLNVEKNKYFTQQYLKSYGLILNEHDDLPSQTQGVTKLFGNRIRLENCLKPTIDIESPKIELLKEINLYQCRVSLQNIYDLMSLPSLKNLILALELDQPISEDDLDALFAKLPTSHLENLSFSIYNNPYATQRKKTLSNYHLMSCFIENVINSSQFSSLKSFGIACDILRYNGFDYLKLNNELIKDLIDFHDFEAIYLNIANWDYLVKRLANNPKGENIRKLMLNTAGQGASEAISEFAQSSYLTNVRELSLSASYDIPQDEYGEELDLGEFNSDVIQELSKSPNLDTVEVLDIGQHCSLDHIESWNDKLNDPNLSALLESNHLKNLTYLTVNIETFLPEDLLKVFNKERFPNLKSLYIRVSNEDNRPPIVEKITSIDELKEFYKKWEESLNPERRNLLKILKEFNLD